MELKKISEDVGTLLKLNSYINKINVLLQSDKDFICSILIEDVEENQFDIKLAYIEENEKYLLVFPEHYSPLIFEKELIEKCFVRDNKTQKTIKEIREGKEVYGE